MWVRATDSTIARRYAPAIAVSLLFILWSPFIGEIRNAIRLAFPGRFVAILTATVGTGLAVAAAGAAMRIRERRLARYGAVALAVLLAAWYGLTFRTGNPEIDAVERFHFLEYGLVGFLFYRATKPARDPSIFMATLLWGALAGTCEEWVQWLVPRRVGEARDVALDLYAVACGVIFSVAVDPPAGFTWHVSADARRRLARFAALVVVAFAIFFHAAHLGYEVTDEEIGHFRSSFTRAELFGLETQRAAEWSRDPPRALPLVGKEDFYLTEGGWRVQLRNDCYARGQFYEAWMENRILEKYFDPFLDLHSFSSGDPHRWPPAQRAEVAGRVAGVSAGAYVSPVGEPWIFVWPTKVQFWTAIGVMLILLVGVTENAERKR